ncbi:MAG: EAL domain-containing protein [Proteobacteria bacterium]|nr:EAL domain-containing protein [Pseudomonadota bacterium]
MTDSTVKPGVLLDALMAAGDISYDWNVTSDKMTFFGDIDALIGADHVTDGATFQSHVNAEDQPRRLQALARHNAAGGRFDCEYRLRRADGSICWVHDRGKIETGAGGVANRMLGTLRIVTERKSAEESQRDVAVYDALTGHYNQSRLREALEHALTHAQRYAAEGGYLVVGIDSMASLASAHDDAILERIFVSVGQKIEECVRTADVIGRLEAFRFGVVLSQCTEPGLAAVADKIKATVAAIPFMTPDGPLPISVSVGGVLFPSDVRTTNAAMHCGTRALDDAMRRGAGTFASHRQASILPGHDYDQEDIGASLVQALRDGHVAFAYQPVVRCADGEIAYYETLLRILDGDKPPVPASVFVPVAEQQGYSQRVDRYGLDLAIAELDLYPDLHLAMNISGLTVTDRAWLRRLNGAVAGRPDIAQRLIIEITETAELYDFEDSLRFISSVRALGCRVSLDDFGVGYTNFRHLQTFPVDTVKIDGSYIRGVAGNAANQKFIDTLLGITTAYGIETVAECVESQADLDYLLAQGVTYLQGWELGRPALTHPVLAAAK